MTASTSIIVREAIETDVPHIRDIFLTVYGPQYPYSAFFDDAWLKRSVYNDEILMLVAENVEQGRVIGTASVILDIGAHSDLVGEFGRLAVHPDARSCGVGQRLMAARIEFSQHRLHVGLVENRAVHPFSQRISQSHGFAPVGFLPMKHPFIHRESIALFARHFGNALAMRDNHPRIVPEVAALAQLAMHNCGLEFDAVVDESSSAYPPSRRYLLETLVHQRLPMLVRIERGRLRHREIFGPVKLHYGFFKLGARHASYLVARLIQDCNQAQLDGPIEGAIGFIHDPLEKGLRILELISLSDDVVRFMLEQLLLRCKTELAVEYIEVDVSADAPRMQRTLLELGFVPAAYVPAMVFHEVERLDVVKMVRLLVPLELGVIELTAQMQPIAELVMRSLTRQKVVPRVAEALPHLELFAGLSDEQAIRVAGVCSVVQFDPGEALLEAGDSPLRILLLLEGRAQVFRPGRELAVGEVRAGESVGESALLLETPYAASVRAVEQVVAAELSRRDLEELNRLRPDIGLVIYRNLARGWARSCDAPTRGFSPPPRQGGRVRPCPPHHPPEELAPHRRYSRIQVELQVKGDVSVAQNPGVSRRKSMSLKILYGVVGEGMGHAIRSSVVIEHLLSQGHQVRAVASQRAYHFLKERFENVGRIHGLHIRYDDDGVQRRMTFLSNLIQLPENLATNIGQYFAMLGNFKPDLVISDFDTFAFLYAKNHMVPLVSLDNMQIINRCRHDDLPAATRTDFQLTRAIVKSKLPGAAHYFITSFFNPPIRKRRTTLVPPILRRSILEAPVTDNGHIVVYQTAATMNNLIGALQKMTQHEFRVYGLNREEDLGNVKLHRFSDEGFVQDLASCRGVIANGGFTLMSECVFLHKPMLSVPIKGQFEQVMNAHYLHALGYGEHWDALDEDLIEHFLRNIPTYQKNLSTYKQDGNRELFDALDTMLPRIAAGERPNDPPADYDDQD